MRETGADRLIIGTIGAPGEREFFLQYQRGNVVRSFALEKAQAAALADRMAELIREVRRRHGLRGNSPAADDRPLVTPVESEFAIVEMSLAWEETEGVVLLEASEGGEGSTVTISISLDQALEFVRRTERVVSSGRSPCPFCALPLNPEGHLCPRANGYRR